ncbi:ATP-binding protein [Massilia sp. CF038]|uniref:ATP-binding protein n=1 Tax=Massilia sp. CF038 TaxID=1881045 RepID=UPI00091B3E10|nr:ATP-binding protein [Massilia sp. CF038]SHH15306.1 two-component system, OmpR family, sensor kinase [Massilia sp. CF038]
MNRIFFRFFVLVMLSITVATFVVYFAISRLFGDPLDDIARRQAEAQIFLIEQYVDKAPTDEWLVRLNKVREVSDIHIDLIPLANAYAGLPASQHDRLKRGEVVLDVANKAFFRRVDLYGNYYVGSADEVILARDLPIDIGLALKMEAVRYVIVALALLIPIALWSRSHWTGLQRLASVADQVGAGQLAARANMPKSASIYPLAERMNHMAGRIESLLEAQRNLLHSVSHELRTPIARLEFALELLRAAAADPALEQRIAAMEGDLAELNGLVNELLSMTRMESGQALRTAPLDLAQALQQCAAALPPGPCAVALDVPAAIGTVEADQRLLARAIGNLLRNAQKYGNKEIRLSARRAAALEIMVDDDGPGIPEAERARVFEPFYRLDRSRDRATGGFGLGLSIASKAIALHQGSIRIEASPLGGARFVITLP